MTLTLQLVSMMMPCVIIDQFWHREIESREREIYRLRTAAIVQGYRVNDAALRIFRNEKLERFKSMFDLASGYIFSCKNL